MLDFRDDPGCSGYLWRAVYMTVAAAMAVWSEWHVPQSPDNMASGGVISDLLAPKQTTNLSKWLKQKL